jgi:hypothetical protein
MIGFIGLFDTAREYTLHCAIVHTSTLTNVRSQFFTAVACYRPLTADVPVPQRCQLSYQYLTNTGHYYCATVVV